MTTIQTITAILGTVNFMLLMFSHYRLRDRVKRVEKAAEMLGLRFNKDGSYHLLPLNFTSIIDLAFLRERLESDQEPLGDA